MSGRPAGPGGVGGSTAAGALVGAVLGGRYRIERLIGEGGMGAVYLAEHTHMRKRLAVKVLHPEMSRMPEVVARFEREAMAAGHMDHPHVAGATDFGKLDDGSFFLVLEYVEGQSLRDVIARDRLDLGRALHVTRQIASALARAHALGIVHRDLKPENIMLVTRDGDPNFVKVLDFGIAKVPVGELAHGSELAGAQALTQLGMVYGTPEYMAPEQALGQSVDARADLYALGVMAFEMIAGTRPYNHESKVTLLGMHVTAPIPSLAERAAGADVPSDVEAVITRLLAKDAGSRFVDARGLIEELDALTAQLAAGGRIVPSAPFSQPRIGAPRPSHTEGSMASSLALGPTRLAEATPGPYPRDASVGEASRSRRLVSFVSRWARSRRAIMAASGAAALLVGAVVLASAGRDKAVSTTGDQAARPVSTHVPTPDPKIEAVVAAAQTTIDRGDFATAIDELTRIEKVEPARADVHRLLERAYTGVRNSREAMREAKLGLDADPGAASDLKLQEDVRNAALVRDAQDEAFALLESSMGSQGIDILYDLAFGATGRLYPQAAARAKRSLEASDVRGRASPALAVLLDFRDAKTCEERHALLERAREHGDVRLLPLIQPYEATRGCGFLGRSDCYPCMHRDRAISEAVSTLQERERR